MVSLRKTIFLALKIRQFLEILCVEWKSSRLSSADISISIFAVFFQLMVRQSFL